jgi:hypothetical protein
MWRSRIAFASIELTHPVRRASVHLSGLAMSGGDFQIILEVGKPIDGQRDLVEFFR